MKKNLFGSILFATLIADLQRFLSKVKNVEPAVKITSEEGAINNHEVTEINGGMTTSEKWSTTIKNFARQLYDTQIFNAEATKLWKLAEEAERPLLILVMGEFKTGKSTFINTLLKDDILTTDALPATAVVTLLTFGEEKTATIHYLDGTKEPYDVSKLAEITAEGDETKEALRKNIEFVELTYPNELLKKMEIVDTPGLNVHKQSHIVSTENFQSRADIVLWLFRPTGGGKKSEKEAIATLGQRLKPLAIVNRIDDIDEDEETVDEVLQKIKKRFGDTVSDVIGVSAQQAHDAILSGEPETPIESRWQNFLERLQTQIAEQSEPLKEKSICEKINEFCSLLNNSITNKECELNTREKYFSNIEAAKENLKRSITNLTDAMNFCRRKQEQIKNLKSFFENNFQYVAAAEWSDPEVFMNTELETIRSLSWLKNFLATISSDEANKFIREIDMYSEQFERSRIHVRDWSYAIKLLLNENDALKQKKSEVDSAEYSYKHSGIFGGEPITDFSGKRAHLNRLISEYNDDLKRLETKRDEHVRQGRNLMENLCTICGDVGKLATKINELLRKELKNCQQTAESIDQTFENEKRKYLLDWQRVKYVQELLDTINKNLLASEHPIFICPPTPENISIQEAKNSRKVLAFTVNRKKILIGISCAIMLALFLTAIKNSNLSTPTSLPSSPTQNTQKTEPKPSLPPSSPAEDTAYLNARTDLSLNGIDLGISISEAEKILGRPKRIEKVDGNDRYIYGNKFYITVIDGKANAFVTENPKFKTLRGIHVGSTYGEVVDKYGTDSKDTQAEGLTLREYPFYSLDGKYSLLRFAINNSGIVEYISIRIIEAPSLGIHWIKDADGIYLWNPEPQEGERITWSGGFVQDGAYKFAEGKGVVTWYNKNGEVVQIDEGPFKHGQRNGRFTHKFLRSGKTVYTTWNNGEEVTESNSSSKNGAEQAFKNYHRAITNGNYREAYNTLSIAQRQRVGDFNSYVKGFSNTISSEVTDMRLVSSDEDSVTFDYTITVRDRYQGRVKVMTFRGQVTMAKDKGRWYVRYAKSSKTNERYE